MRLLVVTLFLSLAGAAGTPVYGAEESPRAYTFQGRFTDTSGTPLSDIISLRLGIYSPDGLCLLYEESQSGVDLTTTGGVFAVQLGSISTDLTKRTSNDPGKKMAEIFANTGVQLRAPGSPNCAGGYTPAPGDVRKLRIAYTPSAGPEVVLSPDETLNSTPQSSVAETLQGIAPSGFLQPNATANLSQTTLQSLTSGTDVGNSLHSHDSLYAKLSSGTAQNLGAGGVYSSGPIGTGVMLPPVGVQLQVKASADNVVGETIRANSATQTADLLQIQDSGGSPIFQVSSVGSVTINNATAATAGGGGTNQSSSTMTISGHYWTGAASATDAWVLQNVLGTGANPTSTLTFTHSGSTGAARLAIPSANVGIGTTSPSNALSVSGNADMSGKLSVGYTTADDGAKPHKFAVISDATVSTWHDDVGQIQIRGATNQNQQLTMGFNTNSNYGWITASLQSGAPQNLTLQPDNGNVGIGTATPGAKLEVAGEIKVGNAASTCNASTEGHFRYNSTEKLMEFCNGTNWQLILATTTVASDQTPDAFSFTDLTDQSLSTLAVSNILNITGVDGPTLVSVSGSGSPQISINGGGWVSAGTITAGQTLRVRQLTPGAVLSSYVAAVTVGDTTDNWSVTTRAGQLRIFRTASSYGGNLGGLSGADAICQSEAGVFGYAGTWKAVISDSTGDAASRLTLVYPIVKASATATVVESTNLWGASLENTVHTVNTGVWTGSTTTGVANSTNCSNWTSSSSGVNGTYGLADNAGNWFMVISTTGGCDNARYLYCIEQ